MPQPDELALNRLKHELGCSKAQAAVNSLLSTIRFTYIDIGERDLVAILFPEHANDGLYFFAA